MKFENKGVQKFIDESIALCTPDKVVLIDGSEEQLESLRNEAVSTGEMIRLNQELLPGCYLHRTAVNDVARVEGRTFICTEKEEDAGPTNNWMQKDKAYELLKGIYKGAMKGRTMYIIPFSMGAVGSPFSKIGIELTDSIYVVLNMAIMTRVGQNVLDTLGDSDDFVRGLHAKADLDEEKRYICQFPEDNTIMSVNSGYGGNVLLGKKCFALRIASYQGRKEGWLAEHMLILGVEKPNGETKYIAAAFPSACGKTNLAMLIPPKEFAEKRLQGIHGRRRHRVDQSGRGRQTVRDQPRKRVLRRGARHECEIQPQRARDYAQGYDLHQRGAQSRKQHRVVGRS